MKVSRQVKYSDDNYGNTTQTLEFDINSSQLVVVNRLLDEWEAHIREHGPMRNTLDMTVREAKEVEVKNEALRRILAELSMHDRAGC